MALRSMARRVWDSPTLMTWASLGANAGRFVVVLPLILNRFPAEDVAVWYLIATLVQVQAMLDFGFGVTGSRFFAYAMGGVRDLDDPTGGTGRPNHSLLGRVYGTLRLVTIGLGLVAGLILGAVGTGLLWRPIGLSPSSGDAWLAWAIVLAGSTISFCGLTYPTYLQGTNRVAMLRRWEAVTHVAGAATSLAVLAAGGGLVGLALSIQAWALFSVLRNRWMAVRTEPEAFAARPRFDRAILAQVWGKAWRAGLGILLNAGVVRVSALLLAQFLAPATMAAYLVAFAVLDRLNQFCMAPFYSKLPAMATFYSSRRWGDLLATSRRGIALTMGLFVAASVVVGLFAEPLFGLVGSRTPFIGLGFWLLLAAGMAVHRYGALHLQLYTLSNDVVWHIADGVSGLLFLATWPLLVGPIGVYAIPAAFLVAYAGFYTWYAVGKSRRWTRALRAQGA